MLTLQWAKPHEGYYRFNGVNAVDLSGLSTIGVYVIWYRGQPGRVVRPGQGKIADRIAAHRRDPKILAYQNYGLLVTWAAVPRHQIDGVERHLADAWPPLVGDAFPDVTPIAVNEPW